MRHLNKEVLQTSTQNEIPLLTMPEEVGESDQEEVKSHVDKSRLEIAQDREVYERKINALDLCLNGSYRENTSITEDIDTPVRHQAKSSVKKQDLDRRHSILL